jgi:hypothetical protein
MTPERDAIRKVEETRDQLQRVTGKLREQQVTALVTDLELAGTLLERSDITRDSETRRRNIANARHAYDTVSRFFPRVECTDAEGQEIQQRLDSLREALEAHGETF